MAGGVIACCTCLRNERSSSPCPPPRAGFDQLCRPAAALSRRKKRFLWQVEKKKAQQVFLNLLCVVTRSSLSAVCCMFLPRFSLSLFINPKGPFCQLGAGGTLSGGLG